MNRREFLEAAGIVSAGIAFSSPSELFANKATEARWRTFDVTIQIEVLQPAGATRIWVPAALSVNTPFQKTISNTYECPGGKAKTSVVRQQGLGIVAAEFPAGVKPALSVTSRVATRNFAVDVAGPGRSHEANSAELSYFLKPTKFVPTDGIVQEKAMGIVKGANTDVDKARVIYEWIVENTYRNPKTRGCGLGDIRFMLESGDLGGKCADLNALYVGLARAAGLPARDVYGIRVAASQMGYKSLGTSSENITKAQHCRAEVYLHEYGWVPVDPADVRKVVLEEPPGHLAMDNEKVKAARARLFGSWEMNWMAYNYAQDVALPGSSGPAVHFLMYPQAETSEGRLDCLAPDTFRYEITSKEVTSA